MAEDTYKVGEDGTVDIKELSLGDALNLAIKMHQQGALEEAELVYRRVLDASPGHPPTMHFLGMAVCQQGRPEEGLKLVRDSIALSPDDPGWHSNLGNLLMGQQQPGLAVKSFETALALAPGHGNAWNNLGLAFSSLNRFQDAENSFKKAIESAPGHYEAHSNLGSLLKAQRRMEEATAHFQAAVKHAPRLHVHSRVNLANVYAGTGQQEKAIEIYEEILALEPENPVVLHMLAALTGTGVPERASDAYVSDQFDNFADGFDAKLRQLGYRAPQLMADALEAAAPSGLLDIVDAGCGTGLCGPLIQHRAKSLIGVDLSVRMLAKAKPRNCYDALEQAELTAFLLTRPGACDCIISADTLCYFGALEEFSAAAAGALRPGGLLIFSVEAAADQNMTAGYVIQVHGRYEHRRGYVEAALAGAGFEIASVENAVLRYEQKNPVNGYVVTARKPVRAACRIENAATSDLEAVAPDPALAEALDKLGTEHWEQERYSEAEKAFRQAVKIDRKHYAAHLNLGLLMCATKRVMQSAAHFDMAETCAPKSEIKFWLMLARAYSATGRKARAAEIYRECLAIEPQNATILHMLAALTGADVPERASDAYVADQFDKFAEAFDAKLKQLGYRAPELMADALEAAAPSGLLDIIDAGCGTGLCGPLVRHRAKTLTGVDLSGKMLAKAKARNCYDSLEQAELTAFLLARKYACDAIISADTLCYFGALEDFSAAAAGALRDGGLLIFSVEAAADQSVEAGFALQVHGRYAHRRSYVEAALTGSGFEIASVENAVLRYEQKDPVNGYVVTARKPVRALADLIESDRAL